jgi:hypothetical protein
VEESHFPAAKEGTALVGPQVLVNVDHCKLLWTLVTLKLTISHGNHDGRDFWSCGRYYESRKRRRGTSTNERLSLWFSTHLFVANANHQTASVWTSPDDQASMQVFQNFVEDLDCGTVYLNRSDAPEPSLPWSGRKDSGRGISLSTLGYDTLTRTKAVCMKVKQ